MDQETGELEELGGGHLRPIEHVATLEERVIREIRGLIVQGELTGGTRLNQRRLGALLGVSQTPIRSALLQLEREGLVSTTPRESAHVIPMSVEDMEEIYAIRGALEGLAARRGAPRMTDEDLDKMRVQLGRVEALARDLQDLTEYIQARWDFHATCYRATGRPRLVDKAYRAFIRGERYNRLLLSSPENIETSLDHYRDFLTQCEARDGEGAERNLKEGVRWCMDSLIGFLPSGADANGG